MTWKVFFDSLIRTQFRFSNLSADCPLVEGWDLLTLSTTVGGEVEKLVGRNQPLPLVKISAFSLDSQSIS